VVVALLATTLGGIVADRTPAGHAASVGIVPAGTSGVSPMASDPTLSFVETGLPTRTNWSVSVFATTNGSGPWFFGGNTTTASFTVPAGTYRFYIGNVSTPSALYLPSPSNATAAVGGSNLTVSVTFVPLAVYPLTFVEQGLANGTYWSARVNNSHIGTYNNQSVSTVLTIGVPAGTYQFTITSSPPYGVFYSATPADGSVTVGAAGARVNVTFVLQTTYTLSFQESGLPSGTDWSAGISGPNWNEGMTTPSPTISFPLDNGTYPFVIQNVSIGNTLYVPTPLLGTATINGSSVVIDVAFAATQSYTITFVESGLPAGVGWSVVLTWPQPGIGNVSYYGTQQGNNITYDLLGDGNYSYAITGPAAYRLQGGLPPTGNLTVAGANLTEAVVFVAGATYAVSFHETGLAGGTPWCVSLGWQVCASGSSLAFKNLSPWHFDYQLERVPGYSASVTVSGAGAGPPSGVIHVTSHAVKVKVHFVRLTYRVTFQESGLASGKSWSVRVQGTGPLSSLHEKHSSKGSTITFLLPDGSYTFTAPVARGYASGGAGTFGVNGSALTVPVSFVKSVTPAGLLGLSPVLVAAPPVLGGARLER